MHKYRKKLLTALFLFIIVCITCLFLFQAYSRFISKSILEDAKIYLTEINKQASSGIKQKIENNYAILQTAASLITLQDTKNSADQIQVMDGLSKQHDFKSIGIALKDGATYTSDDRQYNVSREDFFIEAMRGRPVLSDTITDQIDHSLINVYAIPLYIENKIEAVLFAIITHEKFVESLDPKLGFVGNLYLLNQNTEVVFDSDPKNIKIPLQRVFSKVDDFNRSSTSQAKNKVPLDIFHKKSDVVSFEMDNGISYLCYTPLGIQDWYVCTVVPHDSISIQSNHIIEITFLFFGAIAIAFIILCIFIVINQNKIKNKIQKTKLEFETVMSNIPGGVVQFLYDDNLTITFLNDGLLNLTGHSKLEIKTLLNNSFLNFVHDSDRQDLASAIVDQMTTNKTVEIDCRLKCNNGQYSWFLFKGRMISDNNQNQTCICVLTDISDTKRAQQELNLSMQRYRVVTEQSDSVVFEYSFIDEKIYLSDKWDKKFQFKSDEPDFLTKAQEYKLLHPDDLDVFYETFNAIKNGESCRDCEVRVAKGPGKYIWCRIKASAIFDENGVVYKTVGKIADIDQQKRETENLKQKAEIDSLTGLYNKGTTKILIEDYLMNEGKNGMHALMILDIDNFKKVNDTLGHLIGDSVITDVTKCMKESVRSSDICGRIGGDEFVVLLKNAASVEVVKAKADEICVGFRHTVFSETATLDISGSIGIALFEQDGSTYNELIDKADTALYEAKKRGKNQYRIYGNSQNI